MNKIALILTFLFLSCSKNDHYNYKPPQFSLDLREVKAKTIKELRKMGLYITGIGGGGIDCIKKVIVKDDDKTIDPLKNSKYWKKECTSR